MRKYAGLIVMAVIVMLVSLALMGWAVWSPGVKATKNVVQSASADSATPEEGKRASLRTQEQEQTDADSQQPLSYEAAMEVAKEETKRQCGVDVDADGYTLSEPVAEGTKAKAGELIGGSNYWTSSEAAYLKTGAANFYWVKDDASGGSHVATAVSNTGEIISGSYEVTVTE
ncbi:MAG: hypothetical protein LBJ07_01040 [Actinomycetes bacterium]|nr:hypothetical protein [Actinomycetes bacterium]